MTEKEFSILKAEFMNNIVNGVDFFDKPMPAEWEAFEQMIREKGPFDFVVDGLNIANEANKDHYSDRKNMQPCGFSVSHFEMDNFIGIFS